MLAVEDHREHSAAVFCADKNFRRKISADDVGMNNRRALFLACPHHSGTRAKKGNRLLMSDINITKTEYGFFDTSSGRQIT
jgi:hypothetical protein